MRSAMSMQPSPHQTSLHFSVCLGRSRRMPSLTEYLVHDGHRYISQRLFSHRTDWCWEERAVSSSILGRPSNDVSADARERSCAAGCAPAPRILRNSFRSMRYFLHCQEHLPSHGTMGMTEASSDPRRSVVDSPCLSCQAPSCS